jgi:murein DD-endopeptidase MepM/ murein hydrolase activator NlpD
MEYRRRPAASLSNRPVLRAAALIGTGILTLGPAPSASAAKPAIHRDAHATSHHRRPPAAANRRPSTHVMALSVRRGDSLLAIMKRNRLAGPDNIAMILTAGKRPEARRLQPGAKVAVVVARHGGRDHVESIRFGLNARAIEALRAKSTTRVAHKATPAAPHAITLPVALSEPLAHVRVTSPYGWRVHPVLGSWRFHDGVDFGAPKGTPVLAAAGGVIADIGRRGNYGEYIRVRHGGHVQTAYAHLSGFAHGLHVGSTVARGQVIGYVGRSGLATGPHLYYEVIVDGQRLDPLKIAAMPAGSAPVRTAARVAEGPTGD